MTLADGGNMVVVVSVWSEVVARSVGGLYEGNSNGVIGGVGRSWLLRMLSMMEPGGVS